MAVGTDEVTRDGLRPAAFVLSLASNGAPRWMGATDGPGDTDCRGVAVFEDEAVVVALNNEPGKLRSTAIPEQAIVGLGRDGDVRWAVAFADHVGARGAPWALARDGQQVLVGGTTDRGGVVVAVDAKTGKRAAEPTWVGDTSVTAIAAAGDRLFVAGIFTGEATVAGQKLQGRGKGDVVIFALPR
jgi:hypothetical protein